MTKPLAIIIEDDPQLGEIYSLTLRPEFDTETFIDGDVALIRLGQVVPAIVVLDLNLPTVPGKEVLNQIRKDKRLDRTKVIIATADSNQSALLSEQADIVILKPVSTTQLRELAARLRPA
jgi:DNA-binding response OmpR family regulator